MDCHSPKGLRNDDNTDKVDCHADKAARNDIPTYHYEGLPEESTNSKIININFRLD
ncbi:hypothetical protein [Helicobacter fennelliae]|uniref:hypothetical protein n=1 Tax=Helicobacter fennelliae TaxID=215 RepID=UPI0015EB8E15|nr:hypothetical protein [Helicobacter fennelliae]